MLTAIINGVWYFFAKRSTDSYAFITMHTPDGDIVSVVTIDAPPSDTDPAIRHIHNIANALWGAKTNPCHH